VTDRRRDVGTARIDTVTVPYSGVQLRKDDTRIVVRGAGASYRRVRIPGSSDLRVCVCCQRTKSLLCENSLFSFNVTASNTLTTSCSILILRLTDYERTDSERPTD